MAESMKDFEQELEASFKKIEEGDIIAGTVVSVDETGVVLDLKYYAEGFIPAEEFSREPGFNIKEAVQPGEEIQATVLRKDDGQGNILLSRAEAADVLAWDKLKELQESGEALDVVVKGVDKEKKRLVLSAKELLREKAEKERRNKISNIEVGFVTEGTVESLQPYGAFVDLGNGISGLVHISQICEKRIKKPSEAISVGDKVKVKVIAIKDGKLSLSIKEASDLMAKEVEEETFELPESGEEATTSLGSLFANIKLD